jgi:hypothetical protein
MNTTPENVSNSISTTFHEDVYHEVSNNWKPVTSRHSSDPTKPSKQRGVWNIKSVLNIGWPQADRQKW